MTADELRKRFKMETGEVAIATAHYEGREFDYATPNYLAWLESIIRGAESKHAEEAELMGKTLRDLANADQEVIRLRSRLSSLESRHAEEMREAIRFAVRWTGEIDDADGNFVAEGIADAIASECLAVFLKSKESPQ